MTACDPAKEFNGALECAGVEKRIVGGHTCMPLGASYWRLALSLVWRGSPEVCWQVGAIWVNREKDHYRHREWKPVEWVGRREHVYKA